MMMGSNITEGLCGTESLSPWDKEINDFGGCFQSLALVIPSHALLAGISAYYVGLRGGPFYIRPRKSRLAIQARCGVSVILAILPLVFFGILRSTRASSEIFQDEGWSEILETFVKTLAWSSHFCYVYKLINRFHLSPRGPGVVISLWVICCLMNLIQARSTIIVYSHHPPPERKILFYYALLQNAFLASYAVTLFVGPSDSLEYRESEDAPRDRIWIGSHRTQSYGGFHEDTDPHYLGVAKDGVPFLSKLLFYWVYPLIRKGKLKRLHSSDDVFDLPNDVHTGIVFDEFERARTGVLSSKWLFKVLKNKFGREFLTIGALKLLADIIGFFSPLLLNSLISFIEEKGEDLRWGYGYSFALLATTTFVGISNSHFNFLMNELGLKVRASVVQSIYKQSLFVSRFSLQKYTRGEIINFMSVDADRIVNFSSCMQALWSMPFQTVIALYLLHNQVGPSCFVGVGFSILMIPANKIIASRIGAMSKTMMTAKDKRVKVISEIVEGIRVIKYFCWESFFSDKMNLHRNDELKYLKYRKYLDALCVYLWATTPVLISVSTFALYYALGNELTAPKVFTSMALFAMLNGPLNAFPWVINGLIESKVSLDRIGGFLSLPTIKREDYFTPFNEDNPTTFFDPTDLRTNEEWDTSLVPDVRINEGTFGFGLDSFDLKRLDIVIKKGEFVGIIGPVGSGKTSFLGALLGEMKIKSGRISVSNPLSGIAYVQQQPWLQRGTVRDNILFGQMYRHNRYTKVVHACGLDYDFRTLHRGDLTRVGDKGATLSGGQKARIALARAVYQDKDIYLIDDVFSSLDSKIGLQIYKEVILGLLKSKTRIVCTHHNQYIKEADILIRMSDGQFESVVRSPESDGILSSKKSAKRKPEDNDERNPLPIFDDETDSQTNDEVEGREVGRVSFEIYKKYWLAVGKLLSPLVIFSLILMQVSSNVTDLWLSHWVSVEKDQNSTENAGKYIRVYAGIALSNGVFTFIRAFLFAYGGVKAAKVIHERLFGVLLRAKIYFFDSTPAGRIINRFSSDMYAVDDSLPFILNIFLAQLVGVLGSIVVCIYAVPWFLIVLLPLGFFYHDIQTKYRPASRDLKRIGSISLSPIYEHFTETLDGLPTIRAFKATQRFLLENEELLESSQKAKYASFSAAQWLELRLQLIGSAVVFSLAIISVINYQSVDAGLIGLAVSYALTIIGKLSGLVSSFTETERELVAIERCYEYIDLVYEESYSGIMSVPFNWPNSGVVEFKDVRMRYRDHLPYVLKKISFKTKPNEKIGVIGRVGAGKSSLITALFRLSSFSHGEIIVDGVKIRLLPLKDFRRHLAVIPQDPFIFSGTLRQNLDPYDQYSDDKLWESLKSSYLYKTILSFGPSALDTLLGDGGRSLSLGQKQLLCLARAILSSAKIVCIDEATANVDNDTDRLIQDVLKTAFKDRTVITIAHRLDTVANSDRIIVMSNGQIIEEGSPEELADNPDSEYKKYLNA